MKTTIRFRDLLTKNSLSAIKVLFIFFVFIIAIRAAIPPVVKTVINGYLDDNIKGYTGQIDDFDLSLYRGSYQVEGFVLSKKGSTTVPLVEVKEMDMSIAWKGLLKGKILVDIKIDEPRINIIDSQLPEKKQTGKDLNIKQVLDRFVPFDIESFVVENGTFKFINSDLKVPAAVYADQINVRAFNIRNTRSDKYILPSTLDVTGYVQSKAFFELRSAFNIMEHPPYFDMNFTMEDFDLRELNQILIAYGPVSFNRGKLSIYSEAASKEGRMIGYVKPYVTGVDVVKPNESFKSFKHFGLEILTAGGNLLFRNDKNITAATKIEFQGPLKKPDIDLEKSLGVTLQNKFGNPIAKSLDNSIDINKL